MPKMLVIMPTLATITLAAAWQLARKDGFLTMPYPRHWWLVATFVIVGVMATVAFAVMLPSNLQVLFEMRKAAPNGALIGAPDLALRDFRGRARRHADRDDHRHVEARDLLMAARRLPEPSVIAVASIVLVFFTIGTLASYLPRQAPLAATVTLLTLAVFVGLVAVWRLVVGRTFAWSSFTSSRSRRSWRSQPPRGLSSSRSSTTRRAARRSRSSRPASF